MSFQSQADGAIGGLRAVVREHLDTAAQYLSILFTIPERDLS
jgi:hypothetical protein